MKTLLIINSSGRVNRSITRRLTDRLADVWRAQDPDHAVSYRDLGLSPPPPVNEAWIAAAFADPTQRSSTMDDALRVSDSLLDELSQADAVAIGSPMYNFGMPSQLKAYIDQIVRVGRAFAFDPAANPPYRPLLSSKPVLVITAVGDGALNPGGPMYHLNFLEPHLRAVFDFIGLNDLSFVRAGYDEFQDDRMKRSIAAAELAVDDWATRIASAAQQPVVL